MRRNKNFNSLIQKLKLPALFSIMALLSNDKVNLFNDRLVDFIQYLLVSEFNRSEDKSHYASFIID